MIAFRQFVVYVMFLPVFSDYRLVRWLIIIAPEPSSTSRAGSTSRAAIQSEVIDVAGLNGTPNGTASPADSVRDAGDGKVRGPHGRFVNKGKPPHTATRGPNIRYVKKCMCSMMLSINTILLQLTCSDSL